MQQRQRLSKMDRFTSGKVNTIICTDLAARGLDMLVDIVVQFGVPLNGDTYVHRLGRTARAGRSGESFILVSKKEYSKWKDILSVLSKGTSEEKVQHKTYQFSVDQLEQTK
jgi:superfamily II DNA/RNA helicase